MVQKIVHFAHALQLCQTLIQLSRLNEITKTTEAP
jgi:hypothetical protein